MKKKVLSQINALAKDIILAENDIDIIKTKNTLMHLYEKLTVLEFLNTSLKTEFDKPEQPAIDSKTYREENWFKEPEAVPQPPYEEELVAPLMDKIKDIMAQMPNDAEKVDELLKEILPKQDFEKNDLEDFAANYQEMPVFERKQENEEEVAILEKATADIIVEEKTKSINDKINQGLNVGLNDRIAFIKNLFEDSADDYTRVLSQINSMTTYEEASLFIQNTIKLDYNNWEGKEEYEERFLIIIEKRFN